MFDIYDLYNTFAMVIAVAVVLTFHEFAHAFVADKCGDLTPRQNGRLSINPVVHVDPIGMLCFVFAGFGWAKPVPINPYNFKHYKRGLFLTASAGVIMNYLLAFLFYPLLLLALFNLDLTVVPLYILTLVLDYIFTLNVCFFVFNLIPLPPLDGFRIVEALNKKKGKFFCFIRDYGYYFLLILILLSFISDVGVRKFGFEAFQYLDVLGYVFRFLTDKVSIPITAFWGLFF